jgi:hypothetical protein
MPIKNFKYVQTMQGLNKWPGSSLEGELGWHEVNGVVHGRGDSMENAPCPDWSWSGNNLMVEGFGFWGKL